MIDIVSLNTRVDVSETFSADQLWFRILSGLFQRCSIPENLWTALIQLWTALKTEIFRAKNQRWNSADFLWNRADSELNSADKKNLASGTNDSSMMIDVDCLNEYFAKIGRSFSNLEEMIKPKYIDKTIFLYPTDTNEVFNLLRNCNTTNSSGLDGLSNNLLKNAGPVISENRKNYLHNFGFE